MVTGAKQMSGRWGDRPLGRWGWREPWSEISSFCNPPKSAPLRSRAVVRHTASRANSRSQVRFWATRLPESIGRPVYRRQYF